ncbi:MAG: hypothetical protein V7605_1315 [Acidimicrobiaceae bacterium]|jgi:hypothetical protein
MAGTQTTKSAAAGRADVALAVGLSAAFVGLAVTVTPLVSAAIVVPASVAVGSWRAHTLPRRSPHSLSTPVFSPTAVVRAPKASESASAPPRNITSAA